LSERLRASIQATEISGYWAAVAQAVVPVAAGEGVVRPLAVVPAQEEWTAVVKPAGVVEVAEQGVPRAGVVPQVAAEQPQQAARLLAQVPLVAGVAVAAAVQPEVAARPAPWDRRPVVVLAAGQAGSRTPRDRRT
jgi:hypothetical protein